MKTLRNNLADDYSDQSTYQVGNFCVYQNEVYVCKTAITSAESWTPAHWEKVVFADTLDDIILVLLCRLVRNILFSMTGATGSLSIHQFQKKHTVYQIML